VKASGGPAGTLLLEHLKQVPMPILEEEPERVPAAERKSSEGKR
jgi:hypothetical protein